MTAERWSLAHLSDSTVFLSGTCEESLFKIRAYNLALLGVSNVENPASLPHQGPFKAILHHLSLPFILSDRHTASRDAFISI